MSSSRLRSHLLVLVAVCLSLFVPQVAEAQRRAAVPHKPAVTDFRVQGDRFVVKRAGDTQFRQEFLVFISYFDALTAADNGTVDADLTYIADHGFTGVRIFGTWHDMSGPKASGCIVPFGVKNLFDPNPADNQTYVRSDRLARLIEVIDKAHAKGLIVDLSFDHGTVGDINQFTIAEYKKALTSLTGTLSNRRHVLFDLGNEFDLGEDHSFPTHLSYAEVEELRDAVKAVDPYRIVTASTTYPTEDEEHSPYPNGTAEMAWDTGLDVVAHHEPREADWFEEETADAVVGGLLWKPSSASSSKPVYLQEPRPYKHTAELCGQSNQSDDSAAHQRDALIHAKAAGAAAWLFHLEHGFVLKSSSFVGNISLEPGLQDLIEGTPAHEKLALAAGGSTPPNPTEITLQVSLESNGTGRITSGTIIDCTGSGPDCLETYTSSGASVTLTAAAGTGSTFGGWAVNGVATCGVATTCQVTVDGYTQVRAWFNLAGTPGTPEDTVEYLHQDAFGSVRHVTNAAGTTVGMYNYRPFGEQEDANLPSQLTGHPTPRKFAGKERDAGTGFDYFGARYHLAMFGRFTTVDPMVPIDAAISDPQLWNRYTYVRNNPLRFTDPDGRCIFGCVAEGYGAYMIGAAAVGTALYLNSDSGRAAVSQVVADTRTMITTAAGAISSWFESATRPGTLGKEDHQVTAAEEAARIGGEREVTIETPNGQKGSRRGDAVATDPATGMPIVVQVYRPLKGGGVPKRERDAKKDIEDEIQKTYPDFKVDMVPVRPLPPKPPEPK